MLDVKRGTIVEPYADCFIKYDGVNISNIRKIFGDSFVRLVSESHASTANLNEIHLLVRSYIKMADGQVFDIQIGDYIGRTNTGELFICRPETFEMMKKIGHSLL